MLYSQGGQRVPSGSLAQFEKRCATWIVLVLAGLLFVAGAVIVLAPVEQSAAVS
jgi:hypothetical protein